MGGEKKIQNADLKCRKNGTEEEKRKSNEVDKDEVVKILEKERKDRERYNEERCYGRLCYGQGC